MQIRGFKLGLRDVSTLHTTNSSSVLPTTQSMIQVVAIPNARSYGNSLYQFASQMHTQLVCVVNKQLSSETLSTEMESAGTIVSTYISADQHKDGHTGRCRLTHQPQMEYSVHTCAQPSASLCIAQAFMSQLRLHNGSTFCDLNNSSDPVKLSWYCKLEVRHACSTQLMTCLKALLMSQLCRHCRDMKGFW